MAGRKAIPYETRARLFAASGGFCQRPECLRRLFPEEMGGEVHIAEMAHVIPYGDSGPRHEERTKDDSDPHSFENLILLCPTCHTLIDKSPESFPRVTLLEWKTTHLSNLAVSQGIQEYPTREAARKAIVARLSENRGLWVDLSPETGKNFSYDPESDFAKIWDRRVKSVILPNNYHIIAVLQRNLHLATKDELEIFGRFREHVRGLTNRHICNSTDGALAFPAEMENVFS